MHGSSTDSGWEPWRYELDRGLPPPRIVCLADELANASASRFGPIVTQSQAPSNATISTTTLELTLLSREWLEAALAGTKTPDLGFAASDAFFETIQYVARLRADQLAHDPSHKPWLLRAIVLREERTAIGYVNFHAPPDGRGMVEIGYHVLPAYRRLGYATEAAQAMWDWAAEHGARVLRASVAPDNVPSLAMVQRAGFREVGQQIDEIDGVELVLEREL